MLGFRSAQALTPSELFAQVSPSVWQVHTYDKEGLALAQGSAVVIGTETLITNCHVLRKASRFTVGHESTTLEATLEMWDPERDVCQIKARTMTAPAVPLGRTESLLVGQTVFALGSPRGLELTLSAGLISALRRSTDQHLVSIQISAPISHGSSGGGLFDEGGQLLGITSSGVDALGAQNLNFAIPVDYVRDLPARHQARLEKRLQTAPPVNQPVNQIASAIAPAQAISPPVAGVAKVPPSVNDKVPFLNDRRQDQFRDYYRSSPYPKACAISDNGHFSCTGGTRPKDRNLPTDPKERALQTCADLAGKPCVLYVVDNDVVYRAEAQ
jgi:serine protease Do